MKSFYKIFLLSGLSLAATCQQATAHTVKAEDVVTEINRDFFQMNADLVIDSLKLSGNRQIIITPLLRRDSLQTALPSILVNGRNMHVCYERGTLKNTEILKNYNIIGEVERKNGKKQTVKYSQRVPFKEWMRSKDTRLEFIYDDCGCGIINGTTIGQPFKIYNNPVDEMKAVMITPAVTELPVQKHEGRTRVQFEVNKTDLHINPYTCRNGQRIDNRSQIKMIDDSVKYALTDPNVELAGIRICGYASPESSYIHNETLATGRSKALAEYLGEKYKLPKGSAEYSAVAENWAEFRKEVENSKEITPEQRSALLELIDSPASTPADFDRKEQILKTDPKFSQLYKSKILPEWFPKLRATTFEIRTRLKPMSDENLAKVLDKTPEKLSLNQMFRVARLYPEGSDEFNRVIDIALKYYPEDNTARINAATALIDKGEYERAKAVLEKADRSPEVYNLLGIIATSEDKFDQAQDYFIKAGDLPAAKGNLELLK